MSKIAAHLSASCAVSVDPTAIGDGTSWIQLFTAGVNRGRDGRVFDVGDVASMQAIVDASLRRAGATELMIDYDHQSVFGAVPGVGGTARAAGWMRELQVRPDGIWARVAWTTAAAAAIQGEEYRYISPTFFHDASGKVTCIVCAALLNSPNFDLAGAIAAGAKIVFEAEPTGVSMKKIAKALGLTEDASEDDILAAVAAAQTTLVAVATAAGKPAAAGSDLVSAVQSAIAVAKPDPAKFVPVDQLLAVQTQLATLSATVVGDKVKAAVDQAIADGKIAPAVKDWAMTYATADLAGFLAFAAATPVVVAPGGTAAAKGKIVQGAGEIGEVDLAVCAAMGLDPAAFKKTREAEEKR